MKIDVNKLAAALAAVIVAAIGGEAGGEDAGGKPAGRGRPAGSANKNKGKGKGETDDLGLGEEEEGGDDLGLGEEEEPEYSQEDVVNAFKALKSSHGVDACRAVLKKIGEANVLNIGEDDYDKAMKAIKAAAAKK